MDYKEKLDMLPTYMHRSISAYIDNGHAPGEFLRAIICNDLKEASGRADSVNKNLLNEYVEFFFNYAPKDCWGSVENFQQWCLSRGLNGGFNEG